MDKEKMKKKEAGRKTSVVSELNDSLQLLTDYLSTYVTALRNAAAKTGAQ